MKKKILTVVLICMMMFAGSEAYAAEYEVMPCYNVVSMANCSIASADDGVEMAIWIGTPSTSSLDKVNIELKLKRASGAIAATYNQAMEKQNATFVFLETAAVTVSSYYYYEYTAKCYKGGSLVDTVTGTSASKYHSV